MPSNTVASEGSGVTLVSAEQRPDLIPAFAELNAPVWPKFLDGDEAIIECWDSLFADGLSRYQFAAVHLDEQGGEKVLATSNSIPFIWPRPDDEASLPDGGWDEVLRGGVEALAAGRKANALSALANRRFPRTARLGPCRAPAREHEGVRYRERTSGARGSGASDKEGCVSFDLLR